jgi:uracil-DNA glycosylase
MNVTELVNLIAAGPDRAGTYPDVFNPWLQRDPWDTGFDGPLARGGRLLRHFDCKPKYLLIGEAPGYQGCHFSGVAFTSEVLLMNRAIPRIEPLAGRITTRPRPWAEPSATIVWRVLHSLGIAEKVVMHNAFAWHPHKPGIPMSNRAPTAIELKAGSEVLNAVIDHFASATIIALGRIAERTLAGLGVRVDHAVRHPSMGGAKKFERGMRKIIANV